jgi:excisionase family DNA binding protein
MNKRLLRVTEAAEWASVSRTTAYSWVKSREWPSIRVRGLLRIPVDELEEWVQANLVVDTDEEGERRVTRR